MTLEKVIALNNNAVRFLQVSSPVKAFWMLFEATNSLEKLLEKTSSSSCSSCSYCCTSSDCVPANKKVRNHQQRFYYPWVKLPLTVLEARTDSNGLIPVVYKRAVFIVDTASSHNEDDNNNHQCNDNTDSTSTPTCTTSCQPSPCSCQCGRNLSWVILYNQALALQLLGKHVLVTNKDQGTKLLLRSIHLYQRVLSHVSENDETLLFQDKAEDVEWTTFLRMVIFNNKACVRFHVGRYEDFLQSLQQVHQLWNSEFFHKSSWRLDIRMFQRNLMFLHLPKQNVAACAA